MRRRLRPLLPLAILLLAASGALGGVPPDCEAPPSGPHDALVIETSLGALRIRLFDQPLEAPETVANFRSYVERGDYDGSFFHRLVPGFVIQGGGFFYDPVLRYEAIPTDPAIANEYRICNVKGTLAMAKLGGDPDSATSQWFINLVDNTDDLGSDRNGGFTVFAEVLPEDLPVVDALGALHTEYGPYAIDDPTLVVAFQQLPVLSVLVRDPAGYGPNGCLKVQPDPIIHPTTGQVVPLGTNSCANPTELNAARAATIAAMDPQVPERLVVIERVPEPGAALLLGVGAATLAGARVARRRRLP